MKWSDEENEYLKKHYESNGAIFCTNNLNRSRCAVVIQAKKLGLKFKRIQTKLTEELLKEEYLINKLSIPQLSHKYKHGTTTISKLLKEFNIKTNPYSPLIDIAGNDYNGIIAIRPIKDGKKSIWVFLCKCGKEFETRKESVITGNRVSCGCGNKGKNNARWTGCGELSGSIYANICQGAKIRNLEISVSIEYLWKLFLEQKRKCVFTGIELEFSTRQHSKKLTTASLDRIDSSKGYVEGNVQWVHKVINVMKNNLSDIEFIKYCKLILENNKYEKYRCEFDYSLD